MGEWSELIRAAAALLWPLFAFVVLWVYHDEIRQLLRRFKKGKFLGQELEIKDDLDQLKESAERVADEAAAAPTVQQPVEDLAGGDDELASILNLMDQAPSAALVMLGALIERTVRVFLAESGHFNSVRSGPIRQTIKQMESELGILPRNISGTLDLFWDVRNKIAHGAPASEEDIRRAIDAGLIVLRAIQALPVETNYVEHANVPIFTDEQCTNRYPDGHAVILRTISPAGIDAGHKQAFPTTKDHFRKGMRVAWEWNMGKVWAGAWYRDPESGDIKQGWSASAEFVGRDISSI